MDKGNTPFKIGTCGLCGETRGMAAHHVVPRWFDEWSKDTLNVCRRCHKRVDDWFRTFVLFGDFKQPKTPTWVDLENKRRYDAEYRKHKKPYMKNYAKNNLSSMALFHFRVPKEASYQDIMFYNKKTGTISISRSWS